jgi:hypothetical protein
MIIFFDFFSADQVLLKKQQDCILLLQQISGQIPNQQLQVLGTTYDIQSNIQQYENPILVKYYVGAVQAGLVQPKGTVYSNSISQLRKEVALLHRVFLSAKNYQTFLATAAWARVHVNEGQFVKAFVGAILQHPETQGVILPPLYEIVPQYYIDARIIQEAQNIAIQGTGQSPVVIPVNYTAHLSQSEQQLSYFTQDVGLANYYAYVNLAGYLLQVKTFYQYYNYIQINFLKRKQFAFVASIFLHSNFSRDNNRLRYNTNSKTFRAKKFQLVKDLSTTICTNNSWLTTN